MTHVTQPRCYTVHMFSNPKKVVDALGITSGMSVADVGTGSGEYALALAQQVGHDGRVYAIDVQKELLSKIKNVALTEGFGNVEVVWGDIEKESGAGLSDNSVDLSLVANSLFQFEDKKTAMFEIVRITRPTGKIVIIDWEDSFGGLGPKPEDVFSAGEAEKLLGEFGFKNVSKVPAGDHHYGLIFKKEI